MGPHSRGGGFYPVFLSSLLAAFTMGQYPVQEPEPEFLAPLENHTVSQGRDISFTCVVNHLSGYKVAWIKADTKAILGIHNHMVAHNPRLSVTHNGHNTWKLHIENVQRSDSGEYMCQINTDPMRNQMGHLEVVIPPDILSEESSEDGNALEGGSVRLRCKATGLPEPSVVWRREDSRNIVLRQDTGREKQVVTKVEGETLLLTNVQRADMGNYLCIASNGVPPSVSKRFVVSVHFHPLIKVSNQLVAAPLGSDVIVQCYVEASPRAMNSWHKDSGEKLVESAKYVISETPLNEYSLLMNLTIRALERRDFGGYLCSSSNALGRVDGGVRLQELHLTPKTTIVPVSSRHNLQEQGRDRSRKNKQQQRDKTKKPKKPKGGKDGGSGEDSSEDETQDELLTTPSSSLEPRHSYTGAPPGNLPGYPTRQPVWVPHHNAAACTSRLPRHLWPLPPIITPLLLFSLLFSAAAW